MKKGIAFLLAVLFILALFAGCGGDGTAAPTQAPGGSATAKPTEKPTEKPGGSSGTATDPPVETGEPSPYQFAAGKYELNDEGFPKEKYVYELPLSTTDEVLTNWTVNWSPQYLPEGELNATPTYGGMEDMTGVHIEWHLIGTSSRAENMSVMMASDDMDDILGQFIYYYTSGPIEQAIDDGYIVNLYDYRDYMPNYLWEVYTRSQNSTIRDSVFYKEDVWTMFYGMYATPMFSTGYFLRQDWMDKLGLGKASDVKTYDDFYKILTAFKVNYESAWPMMVYSTIEKELYNWTGFNTTPYSDRLGYMRVKDGVFNFCGTQEDDRELMTMLNKWFSEGLIDPNWSAYGQTSDFTDNLSNGLLGAWIMTPSEVGANEAVSIDPDAEYAPIPRMRRTLDQTIYWGLTPRHTNYGGAAVSATCEAVELAITWLDWCYSDFGADWMNWGPEAEAADTVIDASGTIGYFWYYDENGERRLTDWAMNHPAGIAWLQDCMCYNELSDAGIQMWSRNYAYEGGDRFVQMFEIWNEASNSYYENKWNWPASIVINAEDTEELNALRSDPNTYFQEGYASFFTGVVPMSEWDSFQTHLSELGVDQMTAIYQRYYDEYAAANK